MLRLKCSVNVMIYVGDPEYLGVTHMMRISWPSPCSHPCCVGFRQMLLPWLQESLQAWVFWIVLLMWSGYQAVVDQSFTEVCRGASMYLGTGDKPVSRSVRSS